MTSTPPTKPPVRAIRPRRVIPNFRDGLSPALCSGPPFEWRGKRRGEGTRNPPIASGRGLAAAGRAA